MNNGREKLIVQLFWDGKEKKKNKKWLKTLQIVHNHTFTPYKCLKCQTLSPETVFNMSIDAFHGKMFSPDYFVCIVFAVHMKNDESTCSENNI